MPLDKSHEDIQLAYLAITRENEGLIETIKSIERAKKEWEHAMDCIEDIVILIDRKDNIRRCNRALSALTGKTYNELLNRKWQDVFKESGFRHLISPTGTVEYRHPAGKWFNYNISYPSDIANKDSSVIITLQEITDRKKREDEIRMLQRITSAINEAKDFDSALWIALKEICDAAGWSYSEAWFISHDRTHLACHPIWYSKMDGCERFRAESKSLIFPIGEGIPGRAWLSRKALWIKNIATETSIPRASLARDAGLRSAVAFPIMTNGEVSLVLNFFAPNILEDDEELITLISAITAQMGSAIQRKKAEDEVRKSKAILEEKNIELEKAYVDLKTTQSRLLQQDKMSSIGQIAAGVAHEINSPIGFIMSNLRSLQRYIDRLSEFIKVQSEAVEELSEAGKPGHRETEREDLLKRINEYKRSLKVDYMLEDLGNLVKESLDGAEKVKRIVQDLKIFSHVDQEEYAMANINEGIDTTISIVWNELKYKVTLRKEYGDIPMTKCNLGQINQVIMNMLVNAAHAIEEKGEIKIKTWHDDGFIHVSISDTGCGIPEDKLDRIFEPFFTTKEVGKGTGLGLSIAYDIIKKHNGDISVESRVGKGTTFTIKIPVVEE